MKAATVENRSGTKLKIAIQAKPGLPANCNRNGLLVAEYTSNTTDNAVKPKLNFDSFSR